MVSNLAVHHNCVVILKNNYRLPPDHRLPNPCRIEISGVGSRNLN